MHEADFGIFDLTPFRGVSADAGTIFELGMMIGLGRRAFAYTNDPADLLSRVRRAPGAVFDAATGTWRDADDMRVEDFRNVDNLMIDRALAEQEHPSFATRRQRMSGSATWPASRLASGLPRTSSKMGQREGTDLLSPYPTAAPPVALICH